MTQSNRATASGQAESPRASTHGRAVVWTLLFALNLLVFLAACLFWVRLSTGQWLALGAASFRASLLAPVAEALAMPVSVVYYPWMIAVYALLVSLFVFVPITVAANYRLIASAAFVVVLALVGHAVVLSLAVMVGCMIVSFARHKGYAPPASTALGLISPVALLGLLAYAGIDAAVVQPIQRWIPVSWLILGALAAVTAGLLIASISWLAKARRGVVLPVQIVFLAGSIVVFAWRVGPDRLDYALLRQQIQSPESIFSPESIERWRHLASEHDPHRMKLGDLIRAHRRVELRALIHQANDFVAEHPESPQVSGVLWLMSQMESLELDEHALDNGQIRFSADWPSPEAQPTLLRLVQQHPNRPQTDLARLRLAELALRDIQPMRAEKLLAQAETNLKDYLGARDRPPVRNGHLFVDPPAMPPLQIYAQAYDRVRLLRWLIERNNVLTDDAAAKALAIFMRLNPLKRDFSARLARLRREGDPATGVDPAKTSLADNLELASALSISDNVQRARRLRELAEGLTDAAIQANYELGRLLLQAPHLRQRIPQLKPADQYFRLVSREAPVNPWQDAAAQHLRWLQKQDPDERQ
jgi:hypothetical protein